MDIQAILSQLSFAAENPRKMLEEQLAQGKKVVGCFPSYTPEELVDAAGMVPFGVWGAQMEPYLAKKYLPVFACPILQSSLEMGLSGKLDGLSAVVIPTLCDTFRCITQDWLAGVPHIPMIPVSYPQNRTDAGIRFLRSEFAVVKGKLEEVCGHPITDEDIKKSIRVYNEHTAVMREFTAVANEHLDIIDPVMRHHVMKSAWFMPKAEHTRLMRELVTALKATQPTCFKGRRVILSGIAAEPDGLLQILADNNVAVVGDDLAQESRQYTSPIPEGEGDPLLCLAEKWRGQLCSLAHDEGKKRVDMLVDMARVTGADGMVFCQMKFCDPEEYDYPLIARALKEIGVPTLCLEVDQQPGSTEQVRTRLQTFAEMLG